MATITATGLVSNTARTRRVSWVSMGNADDGQPILIGEQPDGSIQVVGTMGGATVSLEGSNDGVTWATLTDEQGTTIDLTTSGTLAMFIQRTWQIRPTTTAGAGTDVTVYVMLGS